MFPPSAETYGAITLVVVVSYEITPEPDETERKAILGALAAEEAERPAVSAWGASVLPGREDGEP